MSATIDIGTLLQGYATKADVDAATRSIGEAGAAEVRAREQAVSQETQRRESAIAQERQQREAADGEAARIRDAAITDERRQREVDITEERLERETAIAQERQDRTAAFVQSDRARDAAIAGERKARETAITQLERAQDAALDQEVRERLDAIAQERADRQNEFLAALISILDGGRPGLCPEAFSAKATGLIADSSPLDPARSVVTSTGVLYSVRGTGVIAPRATVTFDPDAITILRVRYRRLDDVLDPNNNAIDIGVQWLDLTGEDVGRSLIKRDRDLRVQDGQVSLTLRIPSLVDDLDLIAAPKRAAFWRPYIRTYGSDGQTGVEVLGVTDATFAGVYAPDVSALADRIGSIEAQIRAGLPLSAPILPSYNVADLPKPGNRGRKLFAIDGRAPDAAGVLEPPNAGSGVEVVDNGTKWVISGTNQAVQA